MIRGRDVHRLPIVTLDRGEKVGEVKDLIIDRHGVQVVGLVVDEKGLFGDVHVVPWAEVEKVGLDTVIIKRAGSVVKSATVPEISEILERDYVLYGRLVGTREGTELGKLENFFFDRDTGVVEGFELSGSVGGTASGQAFLPAHPSFEAGKDYIFVDAAAADGLEDLREALRDRAS